MAEASKKQSLPKFPSEMIDLPSGGRLYPEDSPLRSGQVEVKYMTAREEDILTSQNLIKKGVVIDQLLNSLILTPGVSVDNLLLGDKNAVLVASRILAYGPEYESEIQLPNGEKISHKFNLADCPFKELPSDISYDRNEFQVELPVSKVKVIFKLLMGSDDTLIQKELKNRVKIGQTSPEVTTRLKYSIQSMDGNDKPGDIHTFVDNMLARDSLFLRQEIARTTPDIELKQEIDWEGELVTVDIPMTVNFFWPKTRT